MKQIATALLFCLLAAGRSRPHAPAAAPVLVDQGALFVYASPMPPDAAGIALTIESVAAIPEEGPALPLTLFLRDAGRGSLDRERRLAGGALPPGRYTGLSIAFQIARGASITAETAAAGEPGPAPAAATTLPFPFDIAKRHARVLLFQVAAGASAGAEERRTPALSVSSPTQPAVSLLAAASSRGANLITLFDKSSGRIAGIIPTGRAPSGLALDPARRRVYVALPGDDEIASVGLLEQSVLTHQRLRGGDEPVELALTPDGRTLLSANEGSSTVSVMEAVSLVETARIQVGDQPRSVAIDPSGRRAFVFNSGSSTISVIDLAARTVAATIATEAGPFRGEFDRGGERLYVIHLRSPYLTIVDPATLTVGNRIYVGPGATAVKVDARNDRIYLARRTAGQVDVYDPLSLLPIDALPIAGEISFLAIDDEGNNLYLARPGEGEVEVLRIVGKSATARVEVGEDPYGVALLGAR